MCKINSGYHNGKPHFEKMVPPLRLPCPQGGSRRMRCLRITWPRHPDKKCFHKTEIEAANKGAQTGAAANILMGVWGQFAPIITSNDFYQVKKIR